MPCMAISAASLNAPLVCSTHASVLNVAVLAYRRVCGIESSLECSLCLLQLPYFATYYCCHLHQAMDWPLHWSRHAAE